MDRISFMFLTRPCISRSTPSPTNIDTRLQTCTGRKLSNNGLAQSIDSLIMDEIDGATPETPAHHANAQHTWNLPCNLYKCIELDAAYLALVTQSSMRLPEKRPYLLNQSLI